MLTLEEIGQSVRNNIQLVIDNYGLPLAVGPISDDDYRILSGGFGELEWGYALTQFGNDPDRYEFCIKLVSQGVMQGVPAGAAICIYGVDDNIFRIHIIERFTREDEEHPLKGKMLSITIMSAYLFCMAVKCPIAHIMDPDPDLVDYYASFGFMLEEGGKIMSAPTEVLHHAFLKFEH
ncbi:hypothetical protein ACP26E_05285 [Franconibacter pulveris 601]|uniref:hypothetical protein n=1 Tax=Franconibacter pulveris TaxID=435910 RepID=UPI000465C8DC|nr:hypothetical protein [Franconibacter pulveris]